MKKILIVDDSLFMRKVLGDMLSKEYQVIEADSGSRALALAEQESPDLLLLDIIMRADEEEGVGVLEKLMKTSPDTQVVMISAVGQQAMVEKCRKLGAKDYIVKPFDEKAVLQTVSEHTG